MTDVGYEGEEGYHKSMHALEPKSRFHHVSTDIAAMPIESAWLNPYCAFAFA